MGPDTPHARPPLDSPPPNAWEEEEEEEEEVVVVVVVEESLFKVDAANEEDPGRDRATQV